VTVEKNDYSNWFSKLFAITSGKIKPVIFLKASPMAAEMEIVKCS